VKQKRNETKLKNPETTPYLSRALRRAY